MQDVGLSSLCILCLEEMQYTICKICICQSDNHTILSM